RQLAASKIDTRRPFAEDELGFRIAFVNEALRMFVGVDWNPARALRSSIAGEASRVLSERFYLLCLRNGSCRLAPHQNRRLHAASSTRGPLHATTFQTDGRVRQRGSNSDARGRNRIRR